MRVRVWQQNGTIEATVVDADVFTDFAVEIDDGIDLVAAGEALAGRVRFTSAEQAWVSDGWLREAGGYTSGERAESFAKMVEFAATKGWVDQATGELAGHVAYPDMEP